MGEFAYHKERWWTTLSFLFLYLSSRLGFYRWCRSSYRSKDFWMFRNLDELRIDMTLLLVHTVPFVGVFVDTFYLTGWNKRANSVIEAILVSIGTEIYLSVGQFFYVFVVFYEITTLTPTYWKDLKYNPSADPPADLIVIPALEIFEAVPQLAVQWRAFNDPTFHMNSEIFHLSVCFSLFGLAKAIVTFAWYYPSL